MNHCLMMEQSGGAVLTTYVIYIFFVMLLERRLGNVGVVSFWDVSQS